MCDIVGYIDFRLAFPIQIDGLHKLEYRGYNSVGCALISDIGKANIYKAKFYDNTFF